MRRLKNAQISFISLVSRGANRLPFRVIKSEGEDTMLDLTRLRHVFKGEQQATSKPTGLGFAAILNHGKPAPHPVTPQHPAVKAAPAVQSSAKPAQPPRHTSTERQQQQQQVQEERQRQQLAPNQPLHATPAPRRAGNTPKQPAKPSRDAVTLQSLKAEIDSALAAQRQRVKEEDWNESRSAFSRVSPTQPHHVGRGGAGNAWALRNHGGQLATAILSGAGEPLPTNTAFRAFSAAGTKA
ncbi:MAG: hypothetical protein Q4G71_13645 [Pseudomonadota bacterium]|nr:hypothetical protein [Pseudomonadota bacterium]